MKLYEIFSVITPAQTIEIKSVRNKRLDKAKPEFRGDLYNAAYLELQFLQDKEVIGITAENGCLLIYIEDIELME